jgi:hypothetical protein
MAFRQVRPTLETADISCLPAFDEGIHQQSEMEFVSVILPVILALVCVEVMKDPAPGHERGQARRTRGSDRFLFVGETTRPFP